MSEADKMFEELGYEKYEIKDIIQYVSKGTDTIAFEIPLKAINLFALNYEAKRINIQELKAINKKVEELGWN